MRILIVDDSEQIIEILKLLFARPDIEIFTASEPSMALATLEKYDFDMLISDVNMPFMDGFDLSLKVRKKYQKIFIILFTAGICEKEYYQSKLEQIGNVVYIEDKNIFELEKVFSNFQKNVSINQAK